MPKFFIPAVQTKVMTMSDKGLRVIFDTQEPTVAEASDVMSLTHKAGILFFTDNDLNEKELELPPPSPKSEGEKSASQRLRAAIYRKWESIKPNRYYEKLEPLDRQLYSVFEEFYQARMEIFIQSILEELPEPFKED